MGIDRRLMYRPNSYEEKAGSWPFIIEIQGSPKKMDWGQLVGEVWAHSDNPEYYARLFAAAPKMLAALQLMLSSPKQGNEPSEEAVAAARDAISDALERTSCPTCKGRTCNFPCKKCNSVGMVN